VPQGRGLSRGRSAPVPHRPPDRPDPVDYRLAETGTGLTPLVQALADWSLAHRAVIADAHSYDRL